MVMDLDGGCPGFTFMRRYRKQADLRKTTPSCVGVCRSSPPRICSRGGGWNARAEPLAAVAGARARGGRRSSRWTRAEEPHGQELNERDEQTPRSRQSQPGGGERRRRRQRAAASVREARASPVPSGGGRWRKFFFSSR